MTVGFLLMWRLADDGKRIHAMDAFLESDSLLIGEGFKEGKALGSEPDSSWRMTGSAYQAVDVLAVVR